MHVHGAGSRPRRPAQVDAAGWTNLVAGPTPVQRHARRAGWDYGNDADGAITGVSVGTDLVQMLATVEGVTTPFEVGATWVP